MTREEIRELLESRLTIAYDEDGQWRVDYRLKRGARIGVNNRQPAELARAQIRGMIADFTLELLGFPDTYKEPEGLADIIAKAKLRGAAGDPGEPQPKENL